MLTEDDFKYYAPRDDVLAYVGGLIPAGARVLEVGPGLVPFDRATHFVDMRPGENRVICDVQFEPLPFPDKYFDFVYCRHVMEDLMWPFAAMRELSRVGKAGYIETPSPMAEATRGIDRSPQNWRGYYHHFWFVWNKGGRLKFLNKVPMVEYLSFGDETLLANALREFPHQWNNYLLWQEEIKWDYVDPNHPFYSAAIVTAIHESIESANDFMKMVIAG